MMPLRYLGFMVALAAAYAAMVAIATIAHCAKLR
jgi:hypothetical protein